MALNKLPPVLLPELTTPEATATFRKDVLSVGKVIVEAIRDYANKLSEDDRPTSISIGAACYVASYLIGLSSDSKTEVLEGLMATASLNEDNMPTLANLPTNGMKPN